MSRTYGDDLLQQNRTHHTNTTFPLINNLSTDGFPKQNMDLIGEIVELRYRDHYKVDRCDHNGNNLLDTDTDQDWEDYGPEEKTEYTYVQKGFFTVYRCDLVKPYKMISVSEDFSVILVGDSRYYETQVFNYPIQMNEYVGISVLDMYLGREDEIPGITLRVDKTEPCNAVIMEIFPGGSIRLVLGDECKSRLYDYWDTKDYDGKDAIDWGAYIDLEGWKPDYNGSPYKIIDAGLANILHDIVSRAMTPSEIKAFRKKVLSERGIYVSN